MFPITKKLQHRAEAKRRLEGYELVTVYDEDRVWMAHVPTNLLIKHLGYRARWTQGTLWSQIIGAAIGATVGALLFPLFSVALFGVIAGIVLGVMVGMLVGGSAGWLIGPRYSPKPFWTARRSYDEGAHKSVIEPISHTYLGMDLAGHTNGDQPTDPIVQRATSFYDGMSMPDERANLRTASGKKWRTLQIGGLGVIAVCLAVVVIFLIVATAQS